MKEIEIENTLASHKSMSMATTENDKKNLTQISTFMNFNELPKSSGELLNYFNQ
jgi:hypothetical protein